MRLLPSPLWTPNGWFPLTDTEAWFDRLLAADLASSSNVAGTVAAISAASGAITVNQAPSVTGLVSLADTSNGTAYTTGSFTPTEGQLLVIVAGITASTVTPTATASANGITFTLVTTGGWSSGAHTQAFFVADQLVPASPSSMTVTVDCTGDAGTGANVAVLGVTGVTRTGSSAIKQSTANSNVVGTGAAYTLTFGAATASTNIVIGALANNSNPAGITQPSGFTETYDLGYATPTAGLEVAYDLIGGYTSFTWGSTSATVGTANAIELDTTAAPGGGSDFPVTGTIPATSAVAGAVTLAAAVDGAAAAVSTVAGAITADHPLAGTVAATSSATGSVSASMAAAGTAAAVSATSGTIVRQVPGAGSVDAVSGVVGNVTSDHPLSGVVAAVSTVSGVLDGVTTWPLSGTVAAVSAAAGTISTTQPVSGTTAAVSTAAGTVTLGASLSGVVAATSTTAGAVTLRGALTGTVAAVSSTAGSVTAQHPLGGVVPALSSITGAVTLTALVAGTIPAVSTVVGTLTLNAVVSSYRITGSGPTHDLAGDTGTHSLAGGSPRRSLTGG